MNRTTTLLRAVFGPYKLQYPTKVQRLPCNGTGAGPQLWVTSADSIVDFGLKHDAEHGTLAYCPAVFARETDSEDAVTCLRALVLDFDGKDGLHKDEQDLIYHDEPLRRVRVTDALVRFNRTEKHLGPATALVLSGYGLHAIWIFVVPLRVDDENRRHVKEVLRRVAEHAGADKTSATLNHYFRIPGTTNWKGPVPRASRVIAFRPGARLRLEDLLEAVSQFQTNAGSGGRSNRPAVARILLEGVPEGERHASLVRIAAHAHATGLHGPALLAHLLAANTTFRPSSPRHEVEAIARYYEGKAIADDEDERGQAVGPPAALDTAPFRAVGGFVAEYLNYAERQTDAPAVFHVASALAVVAAAVGDRTFLDLAPRLRRIVLFVMCVGGSRDTRKTTATEMATEVLRRAFPDRLCPQDSSPEALVDALVEQPARLLSLNEAATLFARAASDYGRSTLPLLCTLADAPSEYRRRTRKDKGEIVVTLPALCLLAGSNEPLLGQHLRPMDVLSGLIPRFLVAHADRRERTLEVQPRVDQQQIEDLALILRTVAEGAPEQVWFSAASLRAIAVWGREAQAATPAELAPLAGGAEDVARKVGALLHVAARGCGEVGADEVAAAIVLARHALQGAVWVASRHLADTRSAASLNRLRESIRVSMPAGISRRNLLRRLHILDRELAPLLDTLRATGEIEERPVGRTTRFFLRDTRHLNPPGGRPEVSPVTSVTERKEAAEERRAIREADGLGGAV